MCRHPARRLCEARTHIKAIRRGPREKIIIDRSQGEFTSTLSVVLFSQSASSVWSTKPHETLSPLPEDSEVILEKAVARVRF